VTTSETKPPPGLRKRILRSTALVIGGTFVVLLLFIMFMENSYIFFPTKYPQGSWGMKDRGPGPIEDVEFQAADGTKLHGWFGQGKDAELTILYFHGNAGNLSDRYDWIFDLMNTPANVFAIDYRGYGKSEGEPDEAGIYSDGEGALRWLTETRGIPPEKIILYGKSIGGTVACELASRLPCRALILQSTFTSAKRMANLMMPLFPAGLFLRSRFDNLKKIREIKVPKLIIHSRDDEMIPVAMAEQLFEAAPEPKKLVLFDRAGHNDLIYMHNEDLRQAFRTFLK
jgi:fermentation-respiration switch protein FrsA (DUF1100 family)